MLADRIHISVVYLLSLRSASGGQSCPADPPKAEKHLKLFRGFAALRDIFFVRRWWRVLFFLYAHKVFSYYLPLNNFFYIYFIIRLYLNKV